MMKSGKGSFWRKMLQKYKDENILRYSLVFLISFLLMSYLQASPVITDPDAFYHAKMSNIIREQGFVQDFRWLGEFTILGESYANQHVLYHVLLIPFTSFIEPIIGLKIANAFFAAGFITLFFFVLRKNKTLYPEFFSLLLLLSSSFLFRINLGKAALLSLAVLFLGVHFMWKRTYKALFVVSFLYVWVYGGFLLLFAFGGIYSVVVFYQRIFKNMNKVWKISWKAIKKSEEVKVLATIIFGNTLGIITHPYFPQNFAYYKSQLIDIGIVNYQDKIGVGGEWYPYAVERLIADNIWIFLLTIFAGIMMVCTLRKQSTKTIASFGFFLLCFLATLKSKRYVEYLVPTAVFFVAITSARLSHFIRKDVKDIMRKVRKTNSLSMSILGVFILSMFVFVGYSDIQNTKQDLERGSYYTKFKDPMSWLSDNAKQGDIVFHSDWDEFPLLFYYNTKTNYIAGLDPTFMYKHNEDLYWDWVHITKGEKSDNLYKIIKKDFQAQYVFLEKDHKVMDRNISRSIGFTLMYEDAQAKIYKVE